MSSPPPPPPWAPPPPPPPLPLLSTSSAGRREDDELFSTSHEHVGDDGGRGVDTDERRGGGDGDLEQEAEDDDDFLGDEALDLLPDGDATPATTAAQTHGHLQMVVGGVIGEKIGREEVAPAPQPLQKNLAREVEDNEDEEGRDVAAAAISLPAEGATPSAGADGLSSFASSFTSFSGGASLSSSLGSGWRPGRTTTRR